MFLTIIVFIAILSLLVFAHELGHFWTARKFGVTVEEFGFGLPPRVFGLQFWRDRLAAPVKRWRWIFGRQELTEADAFRGTVYSLNWIPLGGFVKIKGENGEDKDDTTSFANKSISRRSIILAAGVAMNFFLCIFLLIIGFNFGIPAAVEGEIKGAILVSSPKTQVIEVIKGLPADLAGVRAGDEILSVDGQTVSGITALQDYVGAKKGGQVKIEFERGQNKFTKDLAVQEYQGINGIGVALATTAIIRFPWYRSIWEGIKLAFVWLFTIISAFFILIRNLIVGQPTGAEVAGPVGIAVLTGQMTRLGFYYVLQFTALLSLNLALINILPLPALDGGRIFFLLIEKIRGRAMKQQLENLAHNLGFALLMLLVVFITYRDVARYGARILGVMKKTVGM